MRGRANGSEQRTSKVLTSSNDGTCGAEGDYVRPRALADLLRQGLWQEVLAHEAHVDARFHGAGREDSHVGVWKVEQLQNLHQHIGNGQADHRVRVPY
jgi:hypothetical protein